MGLGLGLAVQIEARLERHLAALQAQPGPPVEVDRPLRIQRRPLPRSRRRGRPPLQCLAPAPAAAVRARAARVPRLRAAARCPPWPAARSRAPPRSAGGGVAWLTRPAAGFHPAARRPGAPAAAVARARPSRMVCSISPVRDGPVMKLTVRGMLALADALAQLSPKRPRRRRPRATPAGTTWGVRQEVERRRVSAPEASISVPVSAMPAKAPWSGRRHRRRRRRPLADAQQRPPCHGTPSSSGSGAIASSAAGSGGAESRRRHRAARRSARHARDARLRRSRPWRANRRDRPSRSRHWPRAGTGPARRAASRAAAPAQRVGASRRRGRAPGGCGRGLLARVAAHGPLPRGRATAPGRSALAAPAGRASRSSRRRAAGC